MQKLKFSIFSFLAFCVFSSKHIIIYNEETLVALSFFAFILFVSHYFGNTITDSLSEKRETIRRELQNLGRGKEDSFNTLLIEYRNLSEVGKMIKHLYHITTDQVIGGKKGGKDALITLFSQQVEEKLKTVAFSTLLLQQTLQQLMARDLFSYIYFQFQQFKNKKTETSFDGYLVLENINLELSSSFTPSDNLNNLNK